MMQPTLSLAPAMQVYFTDLEPGQAYPAFAMYEIDAMGRPSRKLAVSQQDQLIWLSEFGAAEWVGLGPNVCDLRALPASTLARYRVSTVRDLWKYIGLRLGKSIWQRFAWHPPLNDGLSPRWQADLTVAAMPQRQGLGARVGRPVADSH